MKVTWKILLILVLLLTTSLITSCISQADRESPTLKRISESDLWQPIPTAVGYSTNELLLITLKRQEVINQKLDEILTLFKETQR